MSIYDDLSVESSDLDDLVIDQHTRMASAVNNEGKREQLRFLTDVCHLTEAEIYESLGME